MTGGVIVWDTETVPDNGGFSVSVYQDKAGTDETSRVARDWVTKNAGKTGVGAPTVFEGTVMLQLK